MPSSATVCWPGDKQVRGVCTAVDRFCRVVGAVSCRSDEGFCHMPHTVAATKKTPVRCLCPCRGPVPISCTELRLQVGALKLYGLSQLMLLAAAAAKAKPAAAKLSAGGTAGSMGGDGAAAVRRPAGKGSKPPAGKVLAAVAWMPEKVG